MVKSKSKREHHYWRVTVTYSDGESSGNRVFSDHAKAEKWAERQRRSKVVKKVQIEAFVQQHYKRLRKKQELKAHLDSPRENE